MLRRIRFGRSELTVTELAFGGIPIQRLSGEEGIGLVKETLELGVNFIDTAHTYGHSEELVGEAIRSFPRRELVIASKSPATDKKAFLEDLDTCLERLGTDYVDIYQHHGVSTKEKIAAVMGSGGAFEGMEEAVRAGKVRFPGFSSHSIETANDMIATGKFFSVQIPFNFVDDRAAEEVFPKAFGADMGIIAMKPLGGGLLVDAKLCFRYLSQFEGIVPDPGIENIGQLKEIISACADRSPLTPDELNSIERIRLSLGKEWCHRCDYCRPCPENIAVSTVLTAGSFAMRMPFGKAVSNVGPAMKSAENCTGCRTCVSRCPYGLDIPELLKRRRSEWENYLSAKTWSRGGRSLREDV